MMAVGDHELFVRHRFLNARGEIGIGDRPQAVRDAEFVAQLVRSACAGDLLEPRVDLPHAVVVQQKQLSGLGAGAAKQLDAVSLRSR